jgi:hypothetical protein
VKRGVPEGRGLQLGGPARDERVFVGGGPTQGWVGTVGHQLINLNYDAQTPGKFVGETHGVGNARRRAPNHNPCRILLSLFFYVIKTHNHPPESG